METSIAIVQGLIDVLKTGGLFGLIAFIAWILGQVLKVFLITFFAYLSVKCIGATINKFFNK